jgi:hypothetical protein
MAPHHSATNYRRRGPDSESVLDSAAQQLSSTGFFDVMIQTRQMRILARKPSDANTTVSLLLQARDNRKHFVRMVATRGRPRAEAGAQIITRSWSGEITGADWQWLSLDGYHVSLGTAVPMSGLSGAGSGDSMVEGYALQSYLDCNGQRSRCVEDGDFIDLFVQFESASEPQALSSSVHIVTQVQSQISCEHSSAWVATVQTAQPVTRLVASTSARVHVRIRDVDTLPINFTQAEIECRFDGEPLSQVGWNPGSNEYTIEIPSSMTSRPSEYQVVVMIKNGYPGQASNCTLIQQSVMVVAGFNTPWVLGGSALGAMLLIITLLVMVRRRYGSSIRGMPRPRHAAANDYAATIASIDPGVLVMLFTEVAELAGSMCMEIAVSVSTARC